MTKPRTCDVLESNGNSPEWTAYRDKRDSYPEWPSGDARRELIRMRIAAQESDVRALRAHGLSAFHVLSRIKSDEDYLANYTE